VSVEHAGEVINLKEALDRVDGDHDLLIEIAELFLAECPRFLTEIHTALSQNDAQTLTLAVHTLKGSVGNFAAAGAYEAALKLERIGRQGNLSQAPDALAALEAQLARLKPVLESLKMKAAA
jgi:HPt (histidine-containing phosphotransfer) domain-containing protein